MTLKITFSILLLFTILAGSAQSGEVDYFDKILVGPHINLMLSQAGKRDVRVEASGVDTEKINIIVKNRQLQIYLDNAKSTPPKKKTKEGDMTYKENIYRGAEVTAYVTADQLKKIEFRGEEALTSSGLIATENLKIKLYGETTVNLEKLEASTLKIKGFGAHRISIYDGRTDKICFRVFGDNHLNAAGIRNGLLKTTIYGESSITTHSYERLKVSCLGESKIQYIGSPLLSKGIILGETKFSSMN